MNKSNGWTTRTLSDCISTKKGYAFKSGWYDDDGHPIVKVSNFTDDSIDVDGLTRIRSELSDDYKAYTLRTDDVIVQTVGSWPSNPQSVVGKAIRVPRHANGALLNQNAVRLDPADEIDRKFLFYLLRNDHFKSYIIKTAQGAASQAAITLTSLKAYSFGLPPLPIQRKIASILSAYDDLIENNTRRIAILEEMAQAIYREWFVNFRFPGHENVKLVDSPLGQIPEGWEIKPAREIVDIRYGKTLPKKKILSEGEFPVYGAGSVIGFYDTAICEGRTALVTCRGNGSGTIWRTRQTAFVTNNSLMITPKPEQGGWSFGFIELLLKHSNVAGVISGSAQPQITIDGMSTVPLLVPRTNTVVDFCGHIDVMNDAVDGLYKKNENLRTTRDLLLPKLISGKLDVEDLDIDIAALAAEGGEDG